MPQRAALSVALPLPASTAQNGDAQTGEHVPCKDGHHYPAGASSSDHQRPGKRSDPKIRNLGKQDRCGLGKGRGALVSASTMGTATGARRGGWRCGGTFSTADHAALKRLSQTTRQARFLQRLGNFALGDGSSDSYDSSPAHSNLTHTKATPQQVDTPECLPAFKAIRHPPADLLLP